MSQNDDLISRQAAIDALTEYGSGNDIYMSVRELKRRIEALPPAQPDHIAEAGKKVDADLISRRGAIEALYKKTSRLTVAEEYCHEGHVAWSANVVYRDVMEGALLDLPSAQPEIIRCKDCKHYYYADNRIPQEQRYSCDLDGDRWTSDSFCSFAERREE